MNITAISVCVNYSDFFAWSALANRGLFSKWIIVTDTKDVKTKAIANHYGYQCIQTDVFYEDGKFKKFKGINVGLEKAGKEWVVFLDSDILLPPLTKRVFESLTFDKEHLYGIDRVNYTSFEQWFNYCNSPNLIIDNWLMTSAGGEFGSRINHYYGQQGENGKFGGWKPLGFFQMAHKSQFTEYPSDCKGADHCDIVFANQWEREKRTLIPEIMAIHLESEQKWGINWQGRKSARFEPNTYQKYLPDTRDYGIDIDPCQTLKNSNKSQLNLFDGKY